MSTNGSSAGEWRSTRRLSIILGASLITVTTAASVAHGAVHDTSVAHFTISVDQQKLQACIADGTKNCVTEVPGLEECQERGDVCNIAADEEQASRFVPVTSDGRPLTEKAAVEAALRLSSDPDVPTSAAYVERISWNDFAKRDNAPPPAGADASGNVIAVLVHAPAMTDGGPAAEPVQQSSYYVVYDEKTGNPVTTCIGCAVLP